MVRPDQDDEEKGTLLDSRFANHLACLREDATDPDLSCMERLALVRERARQVRKSGGNWRL